MGLELTTTLARASAFGSAHSKPFSTLVRVMLIRQLFSWGCAKRDGQTRSSRLESTQPGNGENAHVLPCRRNCTISSTQPGMISCMATACGFARKYGGSRRKASYWNSLRRVYSLQRYGHDCGIGQRSPMTRYRRSISGVSGGYSEP